MNPQRPTLAVLKRGQKGTICAVDTACPQVQRLMTLGLVEGAQLELKGAAIGGDPLEYRLFGRSISLRVEQARHFTVAPVGAGE
ncbi:MAG: FeoA family protein [Woeseia sp.]